MKLRFTGLIVRTLKAAGYSALGAAVVSIVFFVVYLDSRTDLNVWHLAELDEEFTADSDIRTFEEYVALEDRLFRQLDELVYGEVPLTQRGLINRYTHGSLSDPASWKTNWNRSFELPAESPRAGVLLLHGMSDSPYSLRHLGTRLNEAGAHVLGVRLPGHGTAPSGLVELRWRDMAAAVRLAVRHLAKQAGERPLYIVGYSAGAALAVHYALETLREETLPRVDRLVVLSPAIGVSAVAMLAVWQARLGHLLGLDKLAWNSLLPEYDPFKYGSFAVNAGHVVYQLTNEIQGLIGALQRAGRLSDFPPLLAFSSIVDATVSTPDLVRGLLQRLPEGGHELVLFDYNRLAAIEPVMKSDPGAVVRFLLDDTDRPYTLSLVSNETTGDRRVAVQSTHPGDPTVTTTQLDLIWPKELYSLAHVALPFPADDELYGDHPPDGSRGIHLGNIALRGERGVLQVPASDMLRLRWNPFYPYLERRGLTFLDLDAEGRDRD